METSKLRVLLSYLFFVISLLSCGQYTYEGKSGNILGGKVLPLAGIVFHQNSNSLITSAYAAPVCDSTVYARLYKLEADGTLSTTPLLSTEVTNGSYQFSEGLPSDIMDAFVKYQIVIDGCDEILYRPVTGLNQSQDVSYTSTLVGHATQTQLTRSLVESSRTEVETLINEIGGTTILQAYNNLDTNPALNSKFQSIFSDLPAQLALSHPSVSVLNFPTMVNEGLSSTFKVSALHFDPGYSVAYEWHLDGSEVGVLNQWVHSPSADSAGSYIVTVYVGHDNGSSRVDRTRPFYALSRTITVLNTIPATPPTFTLASAFSNDGNVTLNINTGVGMEECETFEYFLITESASTPAPSNAGFTRSCTVANTQTETYSITGPQGNKTISLWVKDSNGIVSSAATTQTVVYDNINPIASITSPSGTYKGGSSLALSFSGSDGESGLTNLKIQYSADGTTYSDVATVGTTATSYNWTLPAANSTTAFVRIVATDSAGNVVNATSTAFAIDSTPPSAPSATLASATITNSTSATITVSSCADTGGVFVSQSATAPNSGDAGWQTCSTSAGAITHTITGTDGAKTLYVWAKDPVGNVSTASTLNVTLDQTNPTVALSSLTGGQFIAGASSQAITWSASDLNLGATPVSIEASSDGGSIWALVSGSEANDGSYAWTIPSINTSANKVRIIVTDQAGNSSLATSASNFTIDSHPPSVTTLSITEGASCTNNNVRINLTASDSLTKVTHFCLKYNDTSAPAEGDSCWSPFDAPTPGITPDTSVSFNDFYFLLGFGPGTYSVFSWVKDQAGLISEVSASGLGTENVDKASIEYQPGTPPIVSSVIAASVDDPTNPPSGTDLSSGATSTIHIKWSVSDDQALPPNPISLYYTTDDSNYTPIATNLINGANGACTINHPGTTIDDTATGCYAWTTGFPTSGYFKVRVAAQDSDSMISFSSSSPLNVMPPIRFLAGNTETGLGGSATSALFFSEVTSTVIADPGSLAIAANGTIYFRDVQRGILIISPTDGVQKVLIPTTGSSTGDGGPISGATLKLPLKIALDYQNRLLIFDQDRIRRVDTNTSPMTISTIIGGGTQTTDGVTPQNVKIVSGGGLNGIRRAIPFISFPNGDIYFMSENYEASEGSFRIRVYDASTNTVSSIYPSGTGYYNNPTEPFGTRALSGFGVVFNPVNSQILQMRTWVRNPVVGDTYRYSANLDLSTHVSTPTHPAPGGDNYNDYPIHGMDGQLYFVSRHTARIVRYNLVSDNYTILAGTGTRGTCIDGTVAISCRIDPQDVFVNSSGQVYFMDKGLIRTIDSDGKVVTLAGQSFSFGDGDVALSARFRSIIGLDQRSSGEITILDNGESKLREFNIGGNINLLAGNGVNGTPASNELAVNQPLSLHRLAMDKSTGDVLNWNGRIVRLDRTTGLWTIVTGGGTTVYPSADGLVGTDISYANINGIVPLGSDGTNYLSLIWRWMGGTGTFDGFFKLNDRVTGTQSHLAGITGTDNFFCAVGTTLSSCSISRSSQAIAQYDSSNSRWLISQNGTSQIFIMQPGGTMQLLTTLPRSAKSFFYRNVASEDIVYYCDNGTAKLRKYNITTSTDTAYNWPVASVSCLPYSLIYDSARDSIIFPYSQNGLHGVAEYLSP